MSTSVSNPSKPAAGRGGRAPEPTVLAATKRLAIHVAVGGAIAAEGFDRLSITAISRRAGISRNAFYALYPDKQAAFLAAHERAFAALVDRIEGACAARPEWPQQVREALAAGLDFAASSPAAALLVLADPFAAGPHAAALRERLFDLLVSALRRGRPLRGAEPCPALEEALLGGLLAVATGRLREGRAASLPALAPSLTSFALAPYLGADEATRIAGA